MAIFLALRSHSCSLAVYGLAILFAEIYYVRCTDAAEPPNAEANPPAEQQIENRPLSETKTKGEAEQSQTVAIPLKSIWGGRLQGTRMFGQFDLDMPPGLLPNPLESDIDKALSDPPTEAAKPGFIVVGKSGEALIGAHAVLAENKKPLSPIPSNAEVSLVFFAHGIDYSAHLHDVEVNGHNITVKYQFVPETIKDMVPTYALISLGKLSEGEYHVAVTQLPMDEKYIKHGSKPPSFKYAHRFVCQPFTFSVEPTYIAFTDVGQLDGIGGAEFRFGTGDRMIFIDDVWELQRCARLIPELPWVDLRKESLVILMNWPLRTRCIRFLRSEDATLVVGVKEQVLPDEHRGSHPMVKFWVARLPRWSGPVRFELNGKQQFTIERGEALDRRADQIWEEILDLHSGNHINHIEFIRYLQNLSPNLSDDQVIKEALDKQKLYSMSARTIYPILFQELINLRARSAIPRIFELLQATGKFDPILEHTAKSLIGIGGPELVPNCTTALKSSNPRSRDVAVGVLASLGDPETRPLARSLMNGSDISTIRGGLSIINGIGPTKEDVPKLVRSMQRLESLMFDAPNNNRGPGFEGSSSDDLCAFIYTLGDLGARAEDALPTLEQMATKPRFPLSSTLQEAAQKAVDKIKIDLAKNSP